MKNHKFLNEYLKETFGCKIYKIALESGCSCPNRDGSAGFGGCIFCSAGGSGDFAESLANAINKSSDDQAIFEAAIERAKARVAAKNSSGKYIAYFQSYTNTYGDISQLSTLYKQVLMRDDIVALSIGTRPDCLGDDVMAMLSELSSIKPVWVELGLQTIHNKTAKLINRGYDLSVYEDAYRRLADINIPVITHVILGLPGESLDDMRETVSYLAKLTPVLAGIKLQLLHVLKGTTLGEMYIEGREKPLGYDFDLVTYARFVNELVGMLPTETIIHRVTGDGAKKDLLYPLWTGDKKRVVNEFNKFRF